MLPTLDVSRAICPFMVADRHVNDFQIEALVKKMEIIETPMETLSPDYIFIPKLFWVEKRR